MLFLKQRKENIEVKKACDIHPQYLLGSISMFHLSDHYYTINI